MHAGAWCSGQVKDGEYCTGASVAEMAPGHDREKPIER